MGGRPIKEGLLEEVAFELGRGSRSQEKQQPCPGPETTRPWKTRREAAREAPGLPLRL